MKENFRSLRNNILFMRQQLLTGGLKVNPGEWQSTVIDKTMVELKNVTFESPIPATRKNLILQCDPDLPWADLHFDERISGYPLNPGDTYTLWPYYKMGESFHHDGKFSHTYMERFWPRFANTIMGEKDCNYDCGDEEIYLHRGVRYDYGDLNDIIERLKGNKGTRQAFLSIWHPEDQSNEVKRRLPCTIGYWFSIQDNQLSVSYLIRSCDIIRHFKNDIYLTGRLVHHVAERVGVCVGSLFMWIGSLHCFESDLYTLKKQVS